MLTALLRLTKQIKVAWLLLFIYFQMLMNVPKDYTTALPIICAKIPWGHLYVLVRKLRHFCFDGEFN